MGYFHASKLLKLAFVSSLTRKCVFWKGFYHDFALKRLQLQGASPPDPHQGALPSGPLLGVLPPGPPRFLRPPPTIYPGAAPVCKHSDSFEFFNKPGLQNVKTNSLTLTLSWGWWGRCNLPKENGRKGGWRKKWACSVPAGAVARTWELLRARRGSPAVRRRSCLDK